MRSEGRGFCAKTENRTFATGEGGLGGGSKKRTSANKGGGGVKNHPIYANVIIEWSHPGRKGNPSENFARGL